jgi:GntR family transcriptional regulator
MRGFVDVFLSQGRRSQTQLLSFAPVDPPDHVSVTLKLSPGAKPMQLQRLYVLDGKPVALARAWLTPEANSVTWRQAETHATYEILQKLLHMRIARSEMAIRALIAGRTLGKLLQVPPSAPLLMLLRTSFDTADNAREVTHFAVNSEAYEFTLSGKGPLPIGPALKATAD